jgi:cell wall-associated NlpC family hydrolase
VRPGDLVFFEPTVLGPGHVGIYMGDGRFIEAPHTGDVVKVASLRSANYARSYVGAVRPY